MEDAEVDLFDQVETLLEFAKERDDIDTGKLDAIRERTDELRGNTSDPEYVERRIKLFIRRLKKMCNFVGE